ncbi:glycosyltransferase family 4 protein [Variovorax sp. efr-133-TYG-130]|uniref:glycosyltransferase family 4 protein n=1 Tax=Variovorax sp. efr-133-TYG-130 TaxID=3040327 RepID=UPI002553F4BB|nr:glycosyltransferase family 4 protein [Variovorax sp. efr-133-TYG-130]
MRILIFGPWAITRARHGGQIRAANIVSAYRAAGHDVKFIGIYDPNNVPPLDTTRDDVPIDATVMQFVHASGVPWQISLWRSFAECKVLFERFVAIVRDFKPDVVQFEEPYMWPLVRTLRDSSHLRDVRIIHSSYNFETEYRRELSRIAGHFDEAVLLDVAQQEEQIARECDLVITVSDDDARSFRALGASRVIVARNGSSRVLPCKTAIRAVNDYLGAQSFALFVSSAHPPNAQGLLQFVEGIEQPLPGKLIICGAVFKLLESQRRKHRLLRDAEIWGMVDPEVLQALLARASVVILPKTSGGGSNLKTSEALLSARPVVATRFAFTGFEDWQDLQGVWIEDEPIMFWRRVAEQLRSERDPSSTWHESAFERRNHLLWEACLVPMVDALAQDLVTGAAS